MPGPGGGAIDPALPIDPGACLKWDHAQHSPRGRLHHALHRCNGGGARRRSCRLRRDPERLFRSLPQQRDERGPRQRLRQPLLDHVLPGHSDHVPPGRSTRLQRRLSLLQRGLRGFGRDPFRRGDRERHGMQQPMLHRVQGLSQSAVLRHEWARLPLAQGPQDIPARHSGKTSRQDSPDGVPATC
jgi:hypothetical protein